MSTTRPSWPWSSAGCARRSRRSGSSRSLQFRSAQWLLGKAIDTFLPLGPYLVTADEVPDPQALGIRCLVNDEVLQSSDTGQMVFGVAELVSFISRTITLETEDVGAGGDERYDGVH